MDGQENRRMSANGSQEAPNGVGPSGASDLLSRNDYDQCDRECIGCGHGLTLEMDCEWPTEESLILCWGCMSRKLEAIISAAKDVVAQVDQHGGPYPQYPELHTAIDTLRGVLDG
jgi:hypothetical protein